MGGKLLLNKASGLNVVKRNSIKPIASNGISPVNQAGSWVEVVFTSFSGHSITSYTDRFKETGPAQFGKFTLVGMEHIFSRFSRVNSSTARSP